MSLLAAVLDHYDVRFNPDRDGEQQILCPVHEEKVPSASVNLGKETWHCHACGKGGGAVTIIQEREGIRYAAAIEFLKGIPGGGDASLPPVDRGSQRLPPGTGYSARYRRKISAGRSERPSFGS